jgi:nicotinic acid phosphoribosyltransferase
MMIEKAFFKISFTQCLRDKILTFLRFFYQLAAVNGRPRMKLSEDVEKVTMPGRKDAYRLYGADGNALLDLLQQPGEAVVQQGMRVLCRHPFQVMQFNFT